MAQKDDTCVEDAKKRFIVNRITSFSVGFNVISADAISNNINHSKLVF